MTTLTALQEQELQDRSRDVDAIVAILAGERRPASREDAFLAWSEYSDRACASWLIISDDSNGRDELRLAYDSLVLDRIDTTIRTAVNHRLEEVADFVRDYLAQTSIDEDEPEVLTVSAIADDTILGRMRLHSADDQGLVEALLERFDIEIPDHSPYSRSLVSIPFGIAISDADGFSA